MKFVNLSLLSNPANWLIVWLMVAIGSLGAFYIAKQSGITLS